MPGYGILRQYKWPDILTAGSLGRIGKIALILLCFVVSGLCSSSCNPWEQRDSLIVEYRRGAWQLVLSILNAVKSESKAGLVRGRAKGR